MNSNWKRMGRMKTAAPKPAAKTVSRHTIDPKTIVALDCEMVAVRTSSGVVSALARVSIVDYDHRILLDTYVKPLHPIVNYRTHVSGIEPHHLRDAPGPDDVRPRVQALLRGRVLVGHSLDSDLSVLEIEHPLSHVRDSAVFHQGAVPGKETPSLKELAGKVLLRPVQAAEHSSVDDAKTSMRVYQASEAAWEKWFVAEDGAMKTKHFYRLNKQRKRPSKPAAPAAAPSAAMVAMGLAKAPVQPKAKK